ncbi:MAG: response regulator [Proteobacteria bacterium]|nr:response regulator [Pseudomonadota bacterium]
MIQTRLLIIDDDPVVRLLLQECLMPHGYQIHSTASANEGLQWLATETPDILIVDMIMPEMSGLELLQKFKALPNTSHVPVILLSANTDRKLPNLAAEARPDRILEKPWDMRLLLQTIEELGAVNKKPPA